MECHWFLGSTTLGGAAGRTTLHVQMSRAVLREQGNDGLPVPASSHQCIRTMRRQRVSLLLAGEILASAGCHLSPDTGHYSPAFLRASLRQRKHKSILLSLWLSSKHTSCPRRSSHVPCHPPAAPSHHRPVVSQAVVHSGHAGSRQPFSPRGSHELIRTTA